MKRVFLLVVIVFFGVSIRTNAYAGSREDLVRGTRLYSNLTNTYNVTSVVINSGGTQIGSTLSPSMLEKIQKAISEIEKLKQRLRRS